MEFVKMYYKNEEKLVDVNDVSHYVGMGWTLEKPTPKPEPKVEKNNSKKENKKEQEKNV